MIDVKKEITIGEDSDVVTVSVGFPTGDERYRLGKALHDVLSGERDYANSNILINVEDKTLDGYRITDECGQPRVLVVSDRAKTSFGTKVEVGFIITKEDGSRVTVMQDGTIISQEDENNGE